MIGDSRKSSTNSVPTGVVGSLATRWLSHGVVAIGVFGSPSPVCQIPPPLFWNPGVVRLAGLSRMELWKPQTPIPVYSHALAAIPGAGRLNGSLNGMNPPLLTLKFQGTRSPALGPEAAARIPLLRTPSGTTSV